MKNLKALRIVLIVVLAAILAFFPLAPSASARGTGHKREHNATMLKIQKPFSVTIGQHTLIEIQLFTRGGYPIENQTVRLLVNGAKVRTLRTNFMGVASVDFNPQQAGTAIITAIYDGSHKESYIPSIASTKIAVKPAVIEIQTVPPVEGVNFALGNQLFSSGKDGVARVDVAQTGTYPLAVVNPESQSPEQTVIFSRWNDEVFTPNRNIDIPTSQQLQVGLEVSYPVSHTFVNLSNQPVDPSLITAYELKGSDGKTYFFTDNLTHMLPSDRVVRLNTGLQETKILYSVMDVTMYGSNVVSQASQRFFVQPNDQWPIQLLLYSARFSARDALFPFPLGKGVNVVYPNGTALLLNFGPGGAPTSALLPRGLYHATVLGTLGIAPITPIALSRSQDVNLLVVSDFDIFFVFVFGLIITLGLLYLGRPKIFLDFAALRRRLPIRSLQRLSS
jgi:hypothetical protein